MLLDADEGDGPVSHCAATLPPRADVEEPAPPTSRRNVLLGLGALAAIGCAAQWPFGDEAPPPRLAALPRLPSPGASNNERAFREAGPEIVRWPARRPDAPKGRAFARALREVEGQEREALILRELSAGNVPDFLRRFVPVVLERSAPEAERLDVVLYVLPDYLAVGTDDDFVRVPMWPGTAQLVADAVGCGLPTRAMVDAVYRSAEVKLTPMPMDSGPEMITSAEFVRHHHEIELQRQAKGGALGALTAGHKKDIVITARLISLRRRVAIYGMHKRDGSPIQLLSTLHQSNYVDYAHGVRLVADEMLVGGERRKVSDVLADASLAEMISDEGPLPPVRYPRRT